MSLNSFAVHTKRFKKVTHYPILTLLVAEDDILVREELEELAKNFPERFSLHYTLDRPPTDWAYSSGFITKSMLEKHCLFNKSYKDTQVFICGPPPMIKFACKPNLVELGFKDKDVVIF